MTPGGRVMTRPVGLQVGQGQAGDRLVAERIEAAREAASAPGRSRAALARAFEAVESLSHLPAEPRGARLGRERLEQPFATLDFGVSDLIALAGNLVALVAVRSRPRRSKRWRGSSSGSPR